MVVGLRAREFGPRHASSIKAGTDQDGRKRMARLIQLRMPDKADNRAKLRRDADLAKTSIELKPCQNVLYYQLPFKSSSLENSRPATNQ